MTPLPDSLAEYVHGSPEYVAAQDGLVERQACEIADLRVKLKQAEAERDALADTAARMRAALHELMQTGAFQCPMPSPGLSIYAIATSISISPAEAAAAERMKERAQ